jgi:hypothetical protein
VESSCFGDNFVTQNPVIRLFTMSPDLAKPKNRRLLRFRLLSLLLITAYCAVGAFYFGRKLNVENFDAIEFGMTQKQVERLLGGHPGHYGVKWRPAILTDERFVVGRKEAWTDDDTTLEVFFDKDSKVVGKFCVGSPLRGRFWTYRRGESVRQQIVRTQSFPW